MSFSVEQNDAYHVGTDHNMDFTVTTDGTTAVTSGSVATAFTSELTRPGTIEIAGTLYDIASITDDDNLVTETTVPSGTNQSYNIGTRHYSTITLWEADLDDTVPYDASDDAVGECYNDSNFDETVLCDGGGTIGLNSVKLSVASGERHDGTAGTGAKVVMTGNTRWDLDSTGGTLEWLEIDWAGFSGLSATGLDIGVLWDRVLRLILHDITGNDNAIRSNSGDVLNCIAYDCVRIGFSTAGGATQAFSNCTAHNCTLNGFVMTDDVDKTYQNNISTDSGTADYSVAAPSNAVTSHNLASDTTASGTGSLDSKTAANQYVSTSPEDLHLKSGADAIDAGTDLGTTPSGVEIDINGRDRDAEGDTWDMGAHEFVAVDSIFPDSYMISQEMPIDPIEIVGY